MNRIAPKLQVASWLNADAHLTLESFRGKVVVIEAFQMLCPGCVSQGLPLAVRISQEFSPKDVAVLGLHSVFEHHEVQGTEAALAVFLHEYRIRFPVAIDAPSLHSAVPQTMAAYGLEGTPSLIVIDTHGRQRLQQLGHTSDLAAGSLIGQLLNQRVAAQTQIVNAAEDG